MAGELEKFFDPKSVAIIGASATPGKPGNVVIKNIFANEFAGKLYLVNPRGGTIEGCKVYESIDDLPDGIDLAIIILPAAMTLVTLRACAAKGIKAIVLSASGFAEVDTAGEELQAELASTIKELGVRVFGPNTTGHVSLPSNFTSSFFPLGKLPRGNVSYITQTGNFSGISLRHIMSAENFGVCRTAGLGNKADVEESEILEYFGDDPETGSIFLYLEGIKNPKRFLRVASRVSRKKPTILLLGGASEEGARAALAHTASLAADGRVVDGALAQAGVTRIKKYSHMVHVAKALASMPPPKGNRVAFLSPSGALMVCLTDTCRAEGLEVPEIEERTRKRLQEISPPFIRMRNPVDIYGSVALHSFEYSYGEAMEAVLEDPNIDAVVPILLMTDETGVPTYDFIIDLARKYPAKPIYVTFMGQHKHNVAAKDYLEQRGVPAYMELEEPFEVLGVLARCHAAMTRP